MAGSKEEERLAGGNAQRSRGGETFRNASRALRREKQRGDVGFACFRSGYSGRRKKRDSRPDGLEAVLIGGAAIGGGNHDVLQLMPANADDGSAFGVDRRDIEMARLDAGDAGGFCSV